MTQPGETVGATLGAPLPPGVYGVDTGSIGQRGGTSEGVNIPVILWSTPLVFSGARVEAIVAAPELYVGNHAAKSFSSGMYSPFIGGILAYDFGNGFGASYLAGAYIGISGGDFGPAFNQNTFRQDIHLTYAANRWTANANLICGIVGMIAGSFIYWGLFGHNNGNFDGHKATWDNATNNVDVMRHLWQIGVAALAVMAASFVTGRNKS